MSSLCQAITIRVSKDLRFSQGSHGWREEARAPGSLSLGKRFHGLTTYHTTVWERLKSDDDERDHNCLGLFSCAYLLASP